MRRSRAQVADLTPRPEPAPGAGAPPERRPRRLQALLTAAVLALGAAGAALLMVSRPAVQTRAPEVLPPLVRVVRVEPTSLQLTVTTQGTVAPGVESDLVAEVAGRVVEVAPSLVAGGFFQEGDLLLRIDPRDYQMALESAAAQVARWRSELALARTNRERRQALAREGVVSPALLDEARNAERVASAGLREAQSALARARLDLERSELRAPFTGLVREERVDVGQFVGRGTSLARLFSTDWAEVVLPVANEEMAWLEVPIAAALGSFAEGPAVTLRGRVAGRDAAWPARLVRAEAEIDPRTRMVRLVARVEDPYGLRSSDRPALPVGLFVHAEIEGRRLDDVTRIPREALRGSDELLVVDGEDRLRLRRVEVLRAERDQAVIGAGLAAGERICVSPLEAATEGMQVRVVEDGAADPEPAEPTS